MAPSFYERLCCPIDHTDVANSPGSLTCTRGHQYQLIDGIPVMLVKEADQTQWVAQASMEAAERAADHHDVDPFYIDTLGGLQQHQRDQIRNELHSAVKHAVDPVVQYMLGATNGNLYRTIESRLTTYPVPELPMPVADSVLLDIGCNWGRWCIAAARKGYHPIGIDPSLGAILAARRVSRDCRVAAEFVVADARYLPFRDGMFDVVFSYSVLQHFSKDNVAIALQEAARVLKNHGKSLVQMPNVWGVRCLYHQLRRGFREPRAFEVRYWTPSELKHLFTTSIGRTSLSVDGYFGLGVRPSDRPLLPGKYRLVIDCSECMRQIARVIRWVTYVADSLWVESERAAREIVDSVPAPGPSV